MDILIGNMDFTAEEVGYFDGKGTSLQPITAHIDYFIIKPERKFEGNIDIPFSEYKEMNHADIIQFIKDDLAKVNIQ